MPANGLYVLRAPSYASEDREWSFDDALEAAKKAIELLNGGARDFTVEAPDGRIYRHNEIAQMFRDAQASHAHRT